MFYSVEVWKNSNAWHFDGAAGISNGCYLDMMRTFYLLCTIVASVLTWNVGKLLKKYLSSEYWTVVHNPRVLRFVEDSTEKSSYDGNALYSNTTFNYDTCTFAFFNSSQLHQEYKILLESLFKCSDRFRASLAKWAFYVVLGTKYLCVQILNEVTLMQRIKRCCLKSVAYFFTIYSLDLCYGEVIAFFF